MTISSNTNSDNSANYPQAYVSSDTHGRRHSARIVAAVQNWSASLDSLEAVNSKAQFAAWCELMRAVAGEGSFLGYPRIAKLSRVLHAALVNQIERGQPLNTEQHECLRLIAKSLAKLTVDPSCQLVHTGALAQQIRLAFDLSETEMGKAIPGINYLRDTEGPRQSITTMHRDLDVYLSARLDTLDRCMEEETWIVSQLASLAEDLASGMQSERPANRLMGVLRSHKFFHQVDRVCLAGRVPHSNQLMVVDSAFSDRCESNTLKPGYSCFVNPEGSLFTMRPGTMRIFDDSKRVLESFATNGKPAQRSIALIGDMGLRSGLCLAIGRESDLQGFLFLNSCQTELFREITIKYAPLISLLGLVATIALDSNGFHRGHNQTLSMDSDLPKFSTLFDPAEFQGFMFRSLQRRFGSRWPFQVSTELSNELDDFLYLPNHVCSVLSELALRLQLINAENTQCSISVDHQGAHIAFGIQHRCTSSSAGGWVWLRDHVDHLSKTLGNSPASLAVREQEVVLEVPFEPVLQSHRALRYSVVY